MNMKKIAIAAAVTSLLSLAAGGVAVAGDKAADKAKCYGVAKAGKNDCAANGHSCAGQAKADNDPKEWMHASAEECEKMGGKLDGGKTM
jgi:uncharacterized membrane protein